MLLGRPLPGENYRDWRFVEKDLYDIAGRVRRYDSEARLVHREHDGRLGIARRVQMGVLSQGGAWHLAKYASDPWTGNPLHGTPDARVIEDMARSDFHRIARPKDWYRAQKQREVDIEDYRYKASIERNGAHAERFAHSAWTNRSNRAYISKSIPQEG